MIEVRLSVVITATDDNEADAIIGALNASSRKWPELPIVSIGETSREVAR